MVAHVSTTLTSFINNQSQPTMSYIKHEAKVSRAEIEALVEELENPSIALLNKRLQEISVPSSAAEIVRIHNGVIEAIEQLNKRVEALEAKIR